MTRKSRREIERALEDIGGGAGDLPPLVVFEHPETGEWFDTPEFDGKPVDAEDPDDGGPLMVVVRDEIVETSWSRDE